MSDSYPRSVYRRHSSKRVSQGDIALAEFHQLRGRSGEPLGPGPLDLVAPNLPFFGDAVDYELEVQTPGGKNEKRVCRLWQGFVMTLQQNCEMEFADENDSRLMIAPIVSGARWPEGPWSELKENRVPGYFYLPPIEGDQTTQLGLAAPWPESVVALASTTSSSVGLVKSRRSFSLGVGMLPHLQDSLVRFCAVRGFGGRRELASVEGKRIVRVEETNRSVLGPSKVIKVYFGQNEHGVDDNDDELTVAYWGIRT